MAERRIATRLYVTDELAPGAALRLDPARAHFLRSVLRLGAGAHLAAFNARDGEWLARIEDLGKGRCTLVVEAQRRAPEPEPDLWLVFAPIKRARMGFLAEKATELGCSVLQPVMTRRTALARVNCARLAATAREAAEQCGRLSVPEVRAPLDLGALIAGWPAGRRLLLCAESGPARPIAEALAEMAAEDEGGAVPRAASWAVPRAASWAVPRAASWAVPRAVPRAASWAVPWAVMTGPEGGYAESELDGLRNLPFVTPVGLGPRVLRSDTAALAALACWQAVLGDGRRRPPARAPQP